MDGPLTRQVRLRELLLGVEGLALLRHLYDGTDEDAERRVAEVRDILADDTFEVAEPMTEADARSGYRVWSERYDQPGNLVIAIEEPVVWSMLESLPAGRALDAACGTGRHTRRLAQLGHEVVGVDLTPEMLALARAAPGATGFAEADVRFLPTRSQSFDLVVCALAIAHVADLDSAIAEFARVLRPHGHLVLSALHPFHTHLGWHAPFDRDARQRGFVREHAHTHADYLAAFRSAGLQVRDCREPVLTAADVESKRRPFRHIPGATVAAYEGLPGVLVWDAVKIA